MTAAPPIPGLHTVIVDPRLVIAGEPLFSVESPMTIMGVTPMRWHPSWHVEFRVLVGERKVDKNGNNAKPNDLFSNPKQTQQ